METTETYPFFSLIFVFTGILAVMSIAFYLLFLAFKKRIQLEQEALRNTEINFERQINEATLQAEQQERVQIAMDLHDEIGALVTVLKINLLNAKNKLNQTEHLYSLLTDTAEVVEKTADTIRRISNRISPPTLVKLGIDPTIEELVKTINSTNTMHILLKSNLKGMRFRLDAELNIYRIINETINNILKHSHTKQVSLQLISSNEYLSIHFYYQGLGLTNAQVVQLLRQERGTGLKSIQTRINNFLATIDYLIDKKGKAEIRIKIPINELQN